MGIGAFQRATMLDQVMMALITFFGHQFLIDRASIITMRGAGFKIDFEQFFIFLLSTIFLDDESPKTLLFSSFQKKFILVLA